METVSSVIMEETRVTTDVWQVKLQTFFTQGSVRVKFKPSEGML